MSAPTERTVLVERRILATSQYCSRMCKRFMWGAEEDWCSLTEKRETLHPGPSEDQWLRTPACIEAEVAARGGAL